MNLLRRFLRVDWSGPLTRADSLTEAIRQSNPARWIDPAAIAASFAPIPLVPDPALSEPVLASLPLRVLLRLGRNEVTHDPGRSS